MFYSLMEVVLINIEFYRPKQRYFTDENSCLHHQSDLKQTNTNELPDFMQLGRMLAYTFEHKV